MQNILGGIFVISVYVLLFLSGYYKAKGWDNNFMIFALIGAGIFLLINLLGSALGIHPDETEDN